MTEFGEQEPRDRRENKPPKRYWEAIRKKRFFDLKFSHYIEILLTASLVGIAYFQYTVYKRQAGIMQIQAAIAAKQNEMTAEADRAVVNFHAMGDIQGQGVHQFDFKIGNDGNLTTKNLLINVNCIWSRTAKADPFDLLKPTKNNTVPDLIPPKREIEIPAPVPTDCKVDAAGFQEIIGETNHLYFLGKITYGDDITPIQRITEFAKELVVNVTNPKEPVASAISRGMHNCADKECPKD